MPAVGSSPTTLQILWQLRHTITESGSSPAIIMATKAKLSREVFKSAIDSIAKLYGPAYTMACAIWLDKESRDVHGISSFFVVLNNMMFINTFSHSQNVEDFYVALNALKSFADYNESNHIMAYVVKEIEFQVMSAHFYELHNS